jgi:transcriptional regulator with XRE-family HTH domain
MQKYEQPFLHENIRALRELSGFNQSFVAKKLQVHQSVYSDIEKGIISPCDIKLSRFAEVVKISSEDILMLAERSPIANLKLALEILKNKPFADENAEQEFIQTWIRMFKIRYAGK